MTTRPIWGTFKWPFEPIAKPNPSWPIRTPGCRITRSPISALMTVVCAPIEQSRPIRTPGPMTQWAPIRLRAPTSAPRPDDRSRVDRDVAFEPSLGVHGASRRDAGGSEHGAGPQRIGIKLAEHDRIGALRLGRDQRDRSGRKLAGIALGNQAGTRPRLRQGRRHISDCRGSRGCPDRPDPGAPPLVILIPRSAPSGGFAPSPGHDLGKGRLAGSASKHRCAHAANPSVPERDRLAVP